jgi:hypothetical protein
MVSRTRGTDYSVRPCPHTCSGRGVELSDFVPLHEIPVAVRVGVRGNALEHNGRGAVAEGTVDDVGVTRYPSAISDTGVNVTILYRELQKR